MTEHVMNPVPRAGSVASAWRSLVPSWPLILALAALARVLAQPLAPLNDPDTYLHIAAGRWMIAHMALPVHDPFSYTMAGARWVPHEWLAEIVLAAVFRVAGWSGLVLLTAACFALTLAILARLLLRWAEPFSVLLIVILAAALSLGHVLARPHILTFPLIVLWAGGLVLAREEGTPPPFRLLPLMVLWANLHGSFMFGVALAGFVMIEAVLFPACGNGRLDEVKRWGLFVLLVAGAGLATPNGFAGFIQPFRLIAMPALKSAFVEWRSPNFQHFPALEIWFLGLIALGFATGFKLPPMRLLLVLGLSHMALQSVRNAELLGLVGPLALAPSLGPRGAALIRRLPSSGVSNFIASLATSASPPALLLSLLLAAGISLPLFFHPIARQDGPQTPRRALVAARRMGLLSGHVFNSEQFGGFLIYENVPTFIDGRIEMYGNDFLAHYMRAQSGSAGALSALLDRYHVAWALLAPDEGAAMQLENLKGWRRVYRDDDAAVYVRAKAPR
jgi:hypothetical protein